MNYGMIRYTLAWILFFEAAFFAVPEICALVYGEWKPLLSFLIASAACVAVGLSLLIKRPKSKTLYTREGLVIVSLSWIFLSAFGALPFVISGTIPSYVDALFECASGFTTTGASILTEVESLPKCMLLWRSFTHWVGGMGVLVFIMAFLPLGGARALHIMQAESPGPSVSKLVPRLKSTALILYVIYFALTLLQFTILLFSDMTPFEALNTAFATAGTGGFGIRNDSLASFSPFSQIVVTVFMLIFSVNFSSYYLLYKGRLKDAFNLEFRVFFAIALTAITVTAVNIHAAGAFPTLGECIRHAAFTVASIISTTGFSSTDYGIWPALALTVIVIITFIGGCAGSTAGGLKVSRITILSKGMARELKSTIHPRRVTKITMDGRTVGHEVVRSVNSYVVIYVAVFILSLAAISFENHDLVTNFTAVAATINNVGPGLAKVGPAGNYAFFSIPSKLVLTFDMIAGRLELLPMLVLFSPSTWKK